MMRFAETFAEPGIEISGALDLVTCSQHRIQLFPPGLEAGETGKVQEDRRKQTRVRVCSCGSGPDRDIRRFLSTARPVNRPAK
jgi:hypothetical protein